MVRLLARVVSIGVETADMLVQELSRNMRDRRAVARYAGLTARPTKAGPNAVKRGPLGQRACAARHDPAGMAVSHVSEGQCAGRMVSPPNGECPVNTQDVCGGAGAQATELCGILGDGAVDRNSAFVLKVRRRRTSQ